MAKGPVTSRKKNARVVDTPPTPSQRARKWLFQPRQLAVAAVLAVGMLLIPVVVRSLPELSGRTEYLVGPEQVSITAPPRWIPPDLTQQVFERAGLAARESLQDPTLSERMAAAFHTHPWIEKVISVRKSFPTRIVVDLVYREPVAMVRGVDGHYPVDRRGVLLPARDFSDSDVERFPIIEGVASVPMGNLGESWGDPAVTGAAELAAVLNRQSPQGRSHWQELELSSILVPRRVALTENADDLQYELRTAGGSQILWGRGPDSKHPGELTVAQKIQRLTDFREAYHGFDDQHGPWQIDIRPWQGIQRGVLARESTESSLR